MTTQRRTGIAVSGLALLLLAPFAGGCASTRLVLKQTDASVDMKKYTTCYVADATSAEGVVVPTSVLRLTGDQIASELRGRDIFETVVRTAPTESTQCLSVRTVYTSYRPGSRMLRGLLIGLGTADLKVQVELQDRRDGRQLAKGKVHEYWGWGGLMGASKGIENMQESAVKHIGKGIDKACRRSGRRK